MRNNQLIDLSCGMVLRECDYLYSARILQFVKFPFAWRSFYSFVQMDKRSNKSPTAKTDWVTVGVVP